ncbi:hypothetical protein [Polaribacter sp. SA4-12]|uniref:hypothetical protein n=1 Tax=Polaribacter sp. SA4-12 TaxID=1312072 RepID=UPI000B3CC0C1|nr:hypothetical protein [Polaribacter sp. SA4-12]ARV15143.1 hypothetical protein BTO07_08260 [Polaribacter sp. SA4-12]
MPLKNSKSQTEILESSRIALTNVEENLVIKSLMEELGYNTAKIDEGKTILNEAKAQFNNNQTLEDTRAKAYKAFDDEKTNIETKYAKDRKKAKIVFKQDTLVLKELGIKGIIPKSYVKWLETVNLFYNTLNSQPDILTKLAAIKINQLQVTEILAELTELENLRAAYILAKGNAQNETKTKNIAFKSLDKYMSDFFAVARIALELEPQLLEALGKIVKS